MFILIKPTDLCNLECSYCSVGDLRRSSTSGTMSKEEATLAVGKIYQYAAEHEWQNLALCFHGGEPLIAGLKFYEVVLEFARRQQPKNCDVEISIQSNLTLLNEAFVSLFQEYSVQVSTSLDGPPELHDRLRPYAGGRGTSKQVISALDRLRNCGLKTGVICTINRLNFGFEEDIFVFFKEMDQDFKANHVHNIGAAAINNLGLNPDEIAQSRNRFFDLWFFDPNPRIKEGNTFEIAVNLLTKHPSDCMFQQNCQDSIFSIEFNGFVTACDAIKYLYGKDTAVYYGNIFFQPFDEILTSPNRKKFLKRRFPHLQECVNCEYAAICNGGCMLDSVAQYHNFMRKTPMCSGYKKVFSYIREVLWENNVIQTYEDQKQEVW